MNRVMRIFWLWLATIVLAASTAAAIEPVDPAAVGLSAERLDEVTGFFEDEVDAGRIPGAVVLIARHGRVGYVKAIGDSDVETSAPMAPDTLFRIASMTKAVTSAAVMMLVEEGRIELSDPLSKYLPQFENPPVLAEIDGESTATRPAVREPTIHDLLTHTSGITYGWFGPEKLDATYRQRNIPDLFISVDETIEQRVARLAGAPLKFEPGTAWDYGFSLDVLGRVVEVAAGLTLEQFFQERLFRPLQMRDTFFYVPEEKLGRLASLYTVDGEKSLVQVGSEPVTAGFLKFSADYCHAGKRAFFSGGGGLVSTAGDYLRFLQMLLNRGELEGVRVLQPETVALMTKNQIGEFTVPFAGHGDGFGYGFGVVTDRGAATDRASVGTFSWGGIFNTYFWVDPQEEMIGLLFTQVFPNDHLTVRQRFKELAYEAIDDSGFARVSWYEKGADHANPHFNGRQLRVNAPHASTHPQFAARSEVKGSGMARILIDEDLRAVRRARLYCEVWGGHPGTANKRVTVNGRSRYAFPEVGTAVDNCTHQYQAFHLPVTDLVSGYNSLQFACDEGSAFWGHYIVDNAALVIGIARSDEQLAAAGLEDFRAEVRATASADGESIELTLAGAADQLAKVASVDYQARYYGYDENGNGWATDWHGMTKSRRAYGNAGSAGAAPFAVIWDTSMIPAQANVAVRATIHFKEQESLVYATPLLEGVTIGKPAGETVSIFSTDDAPSPFWSRAGRQMSCTIDVPHDPEEIVAAELHVVAWRGGAGAVQDYFTLNGRALPIAEGSGHDVQYSRLAIDPAILRRGANRMELLSDTDHHGIEILLPGPALAVRTRQRAAGAASDGRDNLKDNAAARRNLYETFALTNAGNPRVGRQLFASERITRCAACHKVDGEGGEAGPDLSQIGGKFDRPHLIESLLEPSRQIVEGFRTTTIVARDGRLITGVVKRQSEQEFELFDAEGKQHTIARSETEAVRDSPVSLMPDDLHGGLTQQQFTDLIAYLETLRSGVKETPGSKVVGGIRLPQDFAIDTIATGLTGCTALETTSDGRIFLCEQTGALRVIEQGKLLDEPFVEIDVDGHWERGLIGVTVDPQFPAAPYVYVCYVAKEPYPHHRVSRLTADGNVAVEGSEKILLAGDDQRKLGGKVPAGHQGGALHFGPDGKLYIAIGEQTAELPSQDLATFQGKLLRINPDGSTPDDNPLLDATSGKYQAIWALGLRNPFTFAFRRSDGLLLINDVGGQQEEINLGVAGGNYGWPAVEHGSSGDERFEAPIHYYPQASIAGGAFVPRDANWPDDYRGRYLFADFVHGWIKLLDPQSPAEARDFASGLRRPVDLRFAVDGSLYVLLRNAWVIDGKFEGGTGSLLRIQARTKSAGPR